MDAPHHREHPGRNVLALLKFAFRNRGVCQAKAVLSQDCLHREYAASDKADHPFAPCGKVLAAVHDAGQSTGDGKRRERHFFVGDQPESCRDRVRQTLHAPVGAGRCPATQGGCAPASRRHPASRAVRRISAAPDTSVQNSCSLPPAHRAYSCPASKAARQGSRPPAARGSIAPSLRNAPCQGAALHCGSAARRPWSDPRLLCSNPVRGHNPLSVRNTDLRG